MEPAGASCPDDVDMTSISETGVGLLSNIRIDQNSGFCAMRLDHTGFFGYECTILLGRGYETMAYLFITLIPSFSNYRLMYRQGVCLL